MKDENVNHQYQISLLLYMELFYKNLLKNQKKCARIAQVQNMRPHYAKCQKMRHMRKNPKVLDFCAAHNCIFPQGVNYEV